MVMRLRYATSFRARLCGLLGQARLKEGEGLWIAPCSAIHTFGMRYAIDVVFVDANHRVLRIAGNIKPGRIVWCWKAVAVIEMAAGQARQEAWRPGSLVQPFR